MIYLVHIIATVKGVIALCLPTTTVVLFCFQSLFITTHHL